MSISSTRPARQLRDPNNAQDASQAVFIVLARKAHSIRQRHSLGAWLLAVARFAATDLRRREHAAREREVAAANLRPESAMPESCPHEVIAVLDDALATLAERDRALLVMRYFEGRTAPNPPPFWAYQKTPPPSALHEPCAACATRSNEKAPLSPWPPSPNCFFLKLFNPLRPSSEHPPR